LPGYLREVAEDLQPAVPHGVVVPTEDITRVLRDALQIVGKVVAHDLMPDIAAPKFPEATMQNLTALLARLSAAPAVR
jgi:hypothetical protein